MGSQWERRTRRCHTRGRMFKALGLLALLISTAACDTLLGAGVGVGAGAAIGAGTGYGAGKGALIGTGVGAVGGTIYDMAR